MSIIDKIKDKKAIIFGLDNVLYPEKDYLLQVYYLFAEFMAYSEQLDSAEILTFMKAEFEQFGAKAIFSKTAKHFPAVAKYETNFSLLHETARLPLKLLLFQQQLSLMQNLVVERKQICILADGKPEIQINKIKQIEWNGLESYLKLYFTEEFETKPATKSIEFILNDQNLISSDIVLIGVDTIDEQLANNAQLDFIPITQLI